MNIIEAIKKRKSIRGYTSEPVSMEILREILELANRAPSAMNTQPWEFVVLGGDVLKQVREINAEKFKAGVAPGSEHSVIGWKKGSVYYTRQVELAKGLFKLMGIAREDTEKRAQWMERGFRFFDSPAAVVILTDKSLDENAPLIDIGIVIQTICLAALQYGLGTCIEDQGCMYPDTLREIAGIPDGKRIVMALAVGYPDWDFPANKIETTRVSVDENTIWRGL
jgi:nitroreductase